MAVFVSNIHFHSGHIWIFVLLLCFGIGITVRRYLRYDISRLRRWSLILLRIMTLLLLCNLASEPSIDHLRRTIRPHTLAILLDASQSMQLRENGQTRWQQALQILESRDLPDSVQVQLYRWDQGLAPIQDVGSISPDGPVTALGDSLQAALDRLQSQRPATLFLISDGRHNQGSSPLEAARRAYHMHLPIHSVLVGGENPRDIQIRTVKASEVGFADSDYSITVELAQQGYDALQTEVIIDAQKGSGDRERVAVTPVTLTGTDTTLDIRWIPQGTGVIHYQVSMPLQPDEAISFNNRQDFRVQIMDQKLRVLYLESVPRWEFRFLRNAMQRDSRLDFNWQLGRTNFDLDSLQDQDLLILGDISARQIQDHLDAIEHFVESGGGLLLHPGQRNAWRDFEGTVLEHMLPVSPTPLSSRGDPTIAAQVTSSGGSTPYLPELTSAGRRHPVSQRWYDLQRAMPVHTSQFFYWYAPVDALKSTATALMVHPKERIGEKPIPLAAYQYYGKGRVFFIGFDELWRWRMGNGDRDFYPFWSQIIQWLAIPHRLGDLDRIQLSTDQVAYEEGQTVQVIARVRDQEDEIATIPELSTWIRPVNKQIPLRPRKDEPGVYEGSFEAPKAGAYLLTLEAYDMKAELPLEVQPRSLEWRNITTNEDLLRQVSEISEGTFCEEGNPWNIPLSPEIVETLHTQTLWDNPWTLLLVLLLLSVEWYLKHRWHLV